MNEVKFNQQFFAIESFLFKHDFEDCKKCLRTSENYKETFYYWVVPMYVYQKNEHWDGEKTFDVCPVDFSKEPKETSWRYKFEVEYDDIGKRVFNTEKEAWEEYEKRYDKTKRKIYKKLRKIHLKHSI